MEGRSVADPAKQSSESPGRAASAIDALGLFSRGLARGAADIIPGVSGGTIALISGVYERFIDALGSLSLGFAPPLLRGRWREARAKITATHWHVLIPLGLGIVVAVAAMSRVVPGLLERYPAETYSFFVGLILASTWVPLARMRSRTWTHVLALLVSGVAAFLFVGLRPETSASDSSADLAPMWWIFICGVIAISAMLLPGVSGAFLLLFLGQYEAVLGAAGRLGDRVLATFTSTSQTSPQAAVGSFWPDILFLGAFAIGLATGLVLFSRTVRWLLHRAHDATMAALTGLMLGALRQPAEDALSGARDDGVSGGAWLWLAAWAVGGAMVVTALNLADRWLRCRRLEAD